MLWFAVVAAGLVLLLSPEVVHAGLYYTGEPLAELPSQWRGFILDQRALRNLAVKPKAGTPASPLRQRYSEEAAKLERAARDRKLTADELADLGALHVRLGDVGKAVDVLRTAHRQYPHHFHIIANLGTAWQLQDDLAQAAACLEEAVRLAPGKMQKAEEYHLKLVRLRQRQKDAQVLDELFEVRYVGDDGQFQPGKLGAADRKKLPADAVAVVQQLALWLPADGRLLWQLAELANAHGDVKTSAAIADGCVTEFGMSSPELRRRRQLLRAAADELTDKSLPGGETAKAAHEGHAGLLRPRSKRPLVNKFDQAALPTVSDSGVNPLPWALLTETLLPRGDFKPSFPKYLQELSGKQISLTGFMQPLGEDLEVAAFMLIEYPVGCWYCEVPEITGIVHVKLPADKTTTFTRGLVKIVGTMILNSKDPEAFLYTIDKAKVSEAD